MSSKDRIFGLDLLRAFAIMTVVYGHGMHLLALDETTKRLISLPVLDGVTIFFVLSGFLIGRILLKTASHERFDGIMLTNFWVRRWFRTLPNYYLVLVLLIILTYLLDDNTPPPPNSYLPYFVFFQNFAWPHPEYFGEAWSLAIEEWFYLLTPIPIYLASKIRNINLIRFIGYYIALVIVLSIAFRVFRIQFFNYGSFETDWLYGLKMQVVTRMDSLMIGVLGAYVCLFHKALWIYNARWKVFVVGVALLVFDKIMHLAGGNLFYLNYFSLSVTPIATLLLLPKLSTWRVGRSVIVDIVTFISIISYSMYLLNQALILETIIPYIMPGLMHYLWMVDEYTALIEYSLFWVFTILGSALLYRYYEVPMTNLRDKWDVGGRASAKAFQSR